MSKAFDGFAFAVAVAIWFFATFSDGNAATWSSDGSVANIQSIHDNNAANGDTITVPAGSFAWSSGLTITKGVTIQGAGAGRLEGNSTSSVAIGTGSKSWTIQSGSIVSSGFTAGETVRAVYKAGDSNYMQGTVTSWNGTTLVLNVTSTGGSGTHAFWNFIVPASTTITHNSSATLFSVTETTANSFRLRDVYITYGTGTAAILVHTPVTNGKPILVHDVRLTKTAVLGTFMFDIDANRGVFWHIYADGGFTGSNTSTSIMGIRVKFQDSNDGGWNVVSTWGAADINGTNNLYIESSYFAMAGIITDWDDNARGVFRYNVVDNGSCASHGNDTSYFGGMQVEYYNNLFIFSDMSATDNTVNLQAFIESRSGTGIIANNVMPDISSGMWGNKSEIKMQLQALDRNAGLIGCWSGNGVAIEYPYPRQVGMGHANSGYTSHSVTSTDGYPAAINLSTGLDNNVVPTYLGDLVPWYQWGNSGGGAYASPSIENSGYNNCTSDDPGAYFQVGRNWINDSRPGYTPYTYPHPLRSGGGLLPAPTNLWSTPR